MNVVILFAGVDLFCEFWRHSFGNLDLVKASHLDRLDLL